MKTIKGVLGWILARWILGVRCERVTATLARMTGPPRAKGIMEEAIRRIELDAWRAGKQAKIEHDGNMTVITVEDDVLEVRYR